MADESFKNALILIVDDEAPEVRLLKRILQEAGLANLISTTDPREVMRLFTAFDPDLVLMDLRMPHLDGYSAIERIRGQLPRDVFMPILVVTGDLSTEARQRALSAGANDFIGKPFDPVEVVLRIRNLLSTRFLHMELQSEKQLLEVKVKDRTTELTAAETEMLERLARAAEYGDDDTGEHPQRVGRAATLIARALDLPEEEVELMGRAAYLHDVGKIGIPDTLLRKTGKLTEEEFEMMMIHTSIGASILSGSHFPLLKLAEEIALTHHERWDGTGYPQGLKGQAIPLVGRIVAVADVFDVLTHRRPWREAWSVEDALAEIERQSGRHFDPEVVEAFLRIKRREGILEPAEQVD